MILLVLFLTFWGTVFISGAIALLISTIMAKVGSKPSHSEGIDTKVYLITWFALVGCLVIWSIISVRQATGHCLVDHGLLNMIRLSIVHLIGVGGVQCQ